MVEDTFDRLQSLANSTKDALVQVLIHEARLLELVARLEALPAGYENCLAFTLSQISKVGLEKEIKQMLADLERQQRKSKKFLYGGFKPGKGKRK